MPFERRRSRRCNPSPTVEIGETTTKPNDVIAATSRAVGTRLPPDAVTISQEPGKTPWRPLLQVDRVVWPSIHVRLQSTAPAAIQQMTEGLLSLCASGSKVLGLASCASGEGVTTLLSAAARKLSAKAEKSCWWMPTGAIRNWPKAWAFCRKSAGKKHSAAACRWKKS